VKDVIVRNKSSSLGSNICRQMAKPAKTEHVKIKKEIIEHRNSKVSA